MPRTPDRASPHNELVAKMTGCLLMFWNKSELQHLQPSTYAASRICRQRFAARHPTTPSEVLQSSGLAGWSCFGCSPRTNSSGGRNVLHHQYVIAGLI